MTDHYNSMPDDALVPLTLLGNQDAYGELVRRYQRMVLHGAYMILRSRFLAEDAAQDAFVTAWTRLDTLQNPARFGPWVCRIAVNRAKNMARQNRDYLPQDTEETAALESRRDYTLWQVGQAEEEASESLRQCLARLSEKIRTIVELHYFEGLSVSEIALQLSLPQGTVKYRLHQGRETLRKELVLMNNMETEKFVKDVLEKVEALKRWCYRNDKTGFAEKYRSVLADVEQIPDGSYDKEKYHAMADVLNLGMWWLPDDEKGDQDELVARLRECCEKSHNESVMEWLVCHDHEKFQGKEKLDFMRNTQIPQLEKDGYVHALGYVWFWLGVYSFENGQEEDMLPCWKKVLEIVPPEDVYYANALAAIRFAENKPEDLRKYHAGACGEGYRYIDGKLYFDTQPGFTRGGLAQQGARSPMYFLSRCDSLFPDDTMTPGETRTASDGKVTMTRVDTRAESGVTVETPAGIFEGCQKWIIGGGRRGEVTAYCKPGVGLVQYVQEGETLVLAEYEITGGTGLFPMAAGNRWKYVPAVPDAYIVKFFEYTVIFADSEKAVLSSYNVLHRTGYGDTWADQMLRVREEYVAEEGDREYLAEDVRPVLAHAYDLAATPYEKAFTRAAQDVMEEIWTTDPEANPGCPWKGHWNFFSPFHITRTADGWAMGEHPNDYHFEWKDTPLPCFPMLHHWIYDMLADAAGCIWSDKWTDGYSETDILHDYGWKKITTDLRVESVPSVTVPAGTFENIIRVHLDAKGLTGGMRYRGGKMVYDFAPGVGIVQALHYYMDGETEKYSQFVLTEMEGTGEGYMPVSAGMRRVYTLADCPDTVKSRAEYTFGEDEAGRMICIAALFGSAKRSEEDMAKDSESK
ncbi:MAG: RNA polymerase sigma factor [Clostridia bacterium]|nr:RNA polymerase sigma factor [Clostridia bacterium]